MLQILNGLFHCDSVFPFGFFFHFSVFMKSFILIFFILFFLPFLHDSTLSSFRSFLCVSLSLTSPDFSLPLSCHSLFFSSICRSFFLSPCLSLFLASLQSHKIWSWLSIYSARGSVTMTTKLEARAPGSYFWSSAVMLDTAFSPLSVCLPLSHCLSVSLSLSVAVSVSPSISLCLIKDRLVKAAFLSGPSLGSDC